MGVGGDIFHGYTSEKMIQGLPKRLMDILLALFDFKMWNLS